MALRLNSQITLTIEKPVSGGRMLARHEGQVVLVAGAIPGERVHARVERVSKQVAFAETIEVLERSDDRRAGDDDWACGGSLYAHIAYQRQLTLKADIVRDAFGRIAKMPLPLQVPVMASQEHGYRMRARLHAANGRLGFFREGTHELCDAGPTRQLLPETMAALERLRDALTVMKVVSCELVENAAGDARAVLVQTDEPQNIPAQVQSVDGITGLLFSDHLSTQLTVSYGSPFVTDHIPVDGQAVTLVHHVQSFFQGNRYLLPQLVNRVAQQVPEGTVTDLYAGVGLFAVPLAVRNRGTVVAVEGDRSSARDLETNAAGHGDVIRVEQTSVEQYLRRRVPRPDTIVLDPPRTGVSPEALSGLLALAAPRVVYLSCDPATLARDVKRFAEAGYRLDHIEAFDLFPNTAHVETLAVLVRQAGRSKST